MCSEHHNVEVIFIPGPNVQRSANLLEMLWEHSCRPQEGRGAEIMYFIPID